jgi:hypothetical protein
MKSGMSGAPSDLDRLLAEELDHARRMLEAMGDELALDVAVVTEHGLALQAVDIVGQMIGHIANVVRAEDRVTAVEGIGMCELRAKLGAAA